jgi:hypothetical protein
MENLNSLELSVLLDMLSEHTSKYTQMLNAGTTNEEYERFKLEIDSIQKEILERRLAFDKNITPSATTPDFTY